MHFHQWPCGASVEELLDQIQHNYCYSTISQSGHSALRCMWDFYLSILQKSFKPGAFFNEHSLQTYNFIPSDFSVFESQQNIEPEWRKNCFLNLSNTYQVYSLRISTSEYYSSPWWNVSGWNPRLVYMWTFFFFKSILLSVIRLQVMSLQYLIDV